MISENEEIGRQRIAERIRVAETQAVAAEHRPHGPRHQLAGALRRLADRLDPAPRRTPLSVSGR